MTRILRNAILTAVFLAACSLAGCGALLPAPTTPAAVATDLATAKGYLSDAVNAYEVAKVAAAFDPKLAPLMAKVAAVADPLVADAEALLADASADAADVTALVTKLKAQVAALKT